VTTLKEWAEQIGQAAASVEGVGHYTATNGAEPPAVIVGAPTLAFEAYNPAPTSATFPVFALVQRDEFAMDRLLDLGPAVVAAIVDNLPDAVVPRAQPAEFGERGQPCYEITVEVSLT
jgi:hypothetical protein